MYVICIQSNFDFEKKPAWFKTYGQINHYLEFNLQFFSELTTQLRISHDVTTNRLYLSSSPYNATSFTIILHVYYRSFRLVSSSQSANSLFIAFILQVL